MQSLLDLVKTSTFIFRGTVLQQGASSVPYLPASDELITARLDESLRTDPVLGDLRGKTITVDVGSETFAVGQQAIFLTNSWVHGRGIAVREVASLDVSEEAAVAAAVAELPTDHLIDRLQDATSIVDAQITEIDPPGFTLDQHDGLWAAALLDVNTALKGSAPPANTFYFATAQWPPWNQMPQFQVGQSGIFVLHTPTPGMVNDGGTLPAGSLVAVDPADFQPESQAEQIKQLLAALA